MSKEKHVRAIWMGDHFLPMVQHARFAESSFTSGHAYNLLVREEKENAARRSKEQNDLMWALLTEIADQVEHAGRKYTADQWKVILMHGCGKEKVQFLPSVEGNDFVPYYGSHSSKLTTQQMTELIEYIRWFGTSKGVNFANEQGLPWHSQPISP